MPASRRVSQIELARDLGVTDRRIRQLVDERVLPRPSDDGYDLDLCRQRYEMYTSGTDHDWDRALDEAGRLAEIAENLNDRAFADDAGLADITAASLAIQATTSMMTFVTACRSKSQSERELFWGIWEREEKRALGGLIVRSMQLQGQTHIRTDDGDVVEVILKSAIAPMSRKTRRPEKAKARRR